jgi:6,7-dimethyl-8-ribityllumazine synthase
METARPSQTLRAEGARVLIVAARYYVDIVDYLIAGARRAIAAAGAQCELVEIPGALEAPGAIAIAATTGRFDAFVALGCVIRGETSHYDIVCQESARGLMDLTVRERLAIGNGILTVENGAQAAARAGLDLADKGGEAARAALAVHLLRTTYVS